MEYLKNLYTKYFSVNLNDYPNINVDFEINKFLFFITLGLLVACVFINYYQGNISLLLKKLIRLNAFSEENSKTLAEIGLADHKPTQRLILKNSGVIKKVIGVVGRKTMTYDEYIKAEKQRKEMKKRLVSKVSDTNDSENKEFSDSAVNSQNLSEELDFSEAKLYIIPEMREYAEHTLKNSSSSIKTALYCILIFAFFVLLVLIMPSLLSLVNGIMA